MNQIICENNKSDFAIWIFNATFGYILLTKLFIKGDNVFFKLATFGSGNCLSNGVFGNEYFYFSQLSSFFRSNGAFDNFCVILI
ncbi:hypothetical protein [Moraxella lacunata]|uniref:hypothetical protein n=1 Tax=Moraxella lacunata TaxID=477 RepID=UPI003EE0DF5A